MTTLVDINGVSYEIPLWRNSVEKEFLLSDDETLPLNIRINNIFTLIDKEKKLENVCINDKLYILIILREFNYGNIIEEIKSCVSCKKTFNIQYKLRENIDYKLGSTTEIIKIDENNITLIDGNISSINGVVVDNISATEYLKYLKLIKELNNRPTSVKINYNYSCPYCNTKHSLVYDEESILNSIIKYYSVSDIYKYYTNMKFNFNFSIQELDDMFVFERTIYDSMFNKIIEDANKN